MCVAGLNQLAISIDYLFNFAYRTLHMQWAHYPNIHFGLNSGREGGKNKLVDEAVAAVAVAPKKIQGFY